MPYTPINRWTRQKMIDHVKSNFKGKSIGMDGVCLYRGPDGKKCAVGLFIPDSEYDPEMERAAFNSDFLKKTLNLRIQCLYRTWL